MTCESVHACSVIQSCWTLPPTWDFSGKNAVAGCHFLLQGIFPTQGSNPCLLHLLHWKVDFSFFFFLPLCQLGSPDVILGPLLSQSSLRILSNILEGEWIIGRSISNLWGWSSYSLLYWAITRQVTPDELGLALVTYVSWVVRAQCCLSNALPNSTCPAANSASPSQDPSLACVGPSWALHAERHWLNAFSVQTIKWNILGAQDFLTKRLLCKVRASLLY